MSSFLVEDFIEFSREQRLNTSDPESCCQSAWSLLLNASLVCNIVCMSDYSEYNEQLQRFRELLTALSDVIADLTPEDLEFMG